MEQEINEEKGRHEELNAQIREWEKKMKDQHKNMGGVHMSRGHIIKTQKNVSKLENQLSQVRTKRIIWYYGIGSDQLYRNREYFQN